MSRYCLLFVLEVFRCHFQFAVSVHKKLFGLFPVATEFAMMSLLRCGNLLVGLLNVMLCFLKTREFITNVRSGFLRQYDASTDKHST